MKPMTRMMMLAANREREPENRGGRRMEIEYEEFRNRTEPENRNRRRYDDGRFAPRQEGGRMEMGGTWPPWNEDAQMRYDGPRYAGGQYRQNGDGNRMIGFYGGEPEYRSDYPMDMTHRGRDEYEPRKGERMHGYAGSREHGGEHLDMHTARKWVESVGETWTMEHTNKALQKRECKCDPLEFWVMVNALKSDFPKLAMKYGGNHTEPLDFFADMAMEWLEDKDARPGKAKNYYRFVVEHG